MISRMQGRVYTRKDLRGMKLKGKPRCPYCEKAVSYVYGDIPQGHISQICPNCGHQVLVDFSSMTVHKVVQDMST